MTSKKANSATKFLKDVDDIMHLLTGKRLKQLVPKAIELFGEDLVKSAIKKNAAPAVDPNDPYNILEIRRDACDLVVNAAWRAKVRVYHPDTGDRPDSEQFQKVNDAHRAIIAERGA